MLNVVAVLFSRQPSLHDFVAIGQEVSSAIFVKIEGWQLVRQCNTSFHGVPLCQLQTSTFESRHNLSRPHQTFAFKS